MWFSAQHKHIYNLGAYGCYLSGFSNILCVYGEVALEFNEPSILKSSYSSIATLVLYGLILKQLNRQDFKAWTLELQSHHCYTFISIGVE